MVNPFLGVFYHAIGGLAAGSFYLPIKKIKTWSWESAWLANGIFAWLLAPWAVSFITIPDTLGILRNASTETLFWTYFFGFLWGIGGLTFGMAMRYLGISLGMAIALGLTAAFGTLIPPIFQGQFSQLLYSGSGQLILLGVSLSLFGIAICGYAGVLKDKNLTAFQKKEGIKEFNLKKGIIVALIAGVLSACFAFGIASGTPIAKLALAQGTGALWQNSPVFVVILAGGFTSNAVWSISLNIRNKTYVNYYKKTPTLKKNYILAAMAGIIWYMQFMFYGMGSTQMGENDFASWSIHMSFIIVFSTLLGLATKEWKSASRKIFTYLFLGLFTLILATIVIGWGNAVANP